MYSYFCYTTLACCRIIETGSDVFPSRLGFEAAELPQAAVLSAFPHQCLVRSPLGKSPPRPLKFGLPISLHPADDLRQLRVTCPLERVLVRCYGETVGEWGITCGGGHPRHSDSRDDGVVNWLGVERPYRHRGLGKLLLFRGRNEMLASGYRHTAISTALHDNRAFPFYSNHGYRLVDWTCLLSKFPDPA